MKAVQLKKANDVADKSLYGGRDFNDSANYLWKDRLNFNIFDRDGYLTSEAKVFIKENAIHRKSFNETWADALLRHAELYDYGYQCDKAPKKRSDVKFSEPMILSKFMEEFDKGNSWEPIDDSGDFEDGIDLTELMAEDIYAPATRTLETKGFREAAQRAMNKRMEENNNQ